MLSLKEGKKIAIINGDKKECIYLREDMGSDPEIETTPENRYRMFQKFLNLDKRLSHLEIKEMCNAYQQGEDASALGKLGRKYDAGIKFVNDSLKRHLEYDASTHLFPVIDEPSYRLFVSGLSGSGKSYFISQFLKVNKPRAKQAGIFLFSPVENDKALSSIPNLIHLNLNEVEAELKREFEMEDIPDGSIVIFDDIESFRKSEVKRYTELRDIFLERGRHRNVSTICVSHNCMGGHTTKVSIREAQYWCLFPKFNSRDTRTILKTYGGLEKFQMDEIFGMKTRWCLYKKTIPKYAIGEHSVITFD